MLCCGALQRNNNTYIESIMEPVFLRIRKRSSLCGFSWEKNPEKGLKQWIKVSWSESRICVRVCVCVCVRVRVRVCVCANSFDIIAITFMVYKKCKSIKRGF